MDDAVASNERGAAGDITGQTEILTLADCIELFRFQSPDRSEKIFRGSLLSLIGLRFVAYIHCIERIAAHEFRHELVPGGGGIEKVEAGDPAVNRKHGACLPSGRF